jgi:DUF1365 family protein
VIAAASVSSCVVSFFFFFFHSRIINALICIHESVNYWTRPDYLVPVLDKDAVVVARMSFNLFEFPRWILGLR